jgi:hypothetical protein
VQLNSLLSDTVQHLSINLRSLLNQNQRLLSDKLVGLALVASYFNTNSFEAKFWSFMAYTIRGGDESARNFNFVVKQNTYLASAHDFRVNEYETLKLFKEKHDLKDKLNHLVKDLLFFNELDMAFHFLVETDPTNEHYSHNLMRACLISSLKNTSENAAPQTSIKLVATNLIANGKLHGILNFYRLML